MTQKGLAEEAKAQQGIIRAQPLFHFITEKKESSPEILEKM